VGAVVAGARVHLTSPNGDRDTVADSGGVYTFDNLIPGDNYAVSVAKAGFSESRAENITVGVNKRSTVDLTLQVGKTSEAVTVEAVAEAIDMSSTSIGANLDESLFKNVPVRRNIFCGDGDGTRCGRQRGRGRCEPFDQRCVGSRKSIYH
jgi:hypothetical protein